MFHNRFKVVLGTAFIILVSIISISYPAKINAQADQKNVSGQFVSSLGFGSKNGYIHTTQVNSITDLSPGSQVLHPVTVDTTRIISKDGRTLASVKQKVQFLYDGSLLLINQGNFEAWSVAEGYSVEAAEPRKRLDSTDSATWHTQRFTLRGPGIVQSFSPFISCDSNGKTNTGIVL